MSLIVCRLNADIRDVGGAVDIRQSLGRNVLQLREEKGWGPGGKHTDFRRADVSDIERGKRNPTLAVVEKLAGPFGGGRRTIVGLRGNRI